MNPRELGVHGIVDNLMAHIAHRNVETGTPLEKSPLWWRRPALVNKVTRSIRLVTHFHWCVELGDRIHMECLPL